jgi:aminopeptidase
MSANEAMIAAARRAMEAALALSANDRVLVVGDEESAGCPAAFAAAARELGCPVTTFDLPAVKRPLQSLPSSLASLLDETDVVINAIDGRSDEIPFRIEWIQAIERTNRIRLGHAPGITEQMMTGGSLDVDYDEMRRREQLLRAGLEGADSVRITAPAGTAIVLQIGGRTFVSDLQAVPGRGVNLPCGELYCAPVEDGADGVILVDGPIGPEGIPPSPLRIEVRKGRVTSVECADEGWQEKVRALMATDATANIVCELGIGLNPGARLAGRMLEDETALRTCHIAFGSNEGMPGGRNRSTMHMDYLIHLPTIVASHADGRMVQVLREGKLQPLNP